MVDVAPSNLSAIEHGRRRPPTDPAKLEEFAATLGLVRDSEDWNRFFDSAREPGELPADVRHVADRKRIPLLLRTIENRKLDDSEISNLIRDLNKAHGGAISGATE